MPTVLTAGVTARQQSYVCLQFLHEDMFSLINVATAAKDVNKAKVRFPLAKYNFLK